VRKTNHKYKEVIDGQEIPEPDMEELIYQTLLGSFPLNREESIDFRERFKQYILKSAREAKTYTNWIRPDERYEVAIISFVDTILKEQESNEFLDDFVPFRKKIAFFGALNSLSQVLLKITSPGVPDFYQGNEFWKFDLVDPDNRRPVDFKARSESLSVLIQREKEDKTGLVRDLLKNWQDGRIKLYLTYKALNFRRGNSDLFQKGEYLPLYTAGKKSENIVAFARHLENQWVIVAVPRLSCHLVEPWDYPLNRHVWGKDTLVLPDKTPSDWVNVVTGETMNQKEEAHMQLAQVFNTFPLALLTSQYIRPGLEKT
jgi:(1->4)-alpha-D-glucan 1-alpha-D-glucosylmutase